jgi:predicted RNase H-like HicB family nuclease
MKKHAAATVRRLAAKTYRLLAVIRKDNDGYSVVVPLLPGALSCGDTLEEAKANIREAAEGVIESYLEHDGSIPWRKEPLAEDRQGPGDVAFEFTVDA